MLIAAKSSRPGKIFNAATSDGLLGEYLPSLPQRLHGKAACTSLTLIRSSLAVVSNQKNANFEY